MDISERNDNGVVIFTLKGRVDSAGANEMDQALQRAATNGQHKMILDMAETTYINSAGLRTLADFLTRNRDNDGDLLLVALHPKVERVFKIIGFDKFFKTYPNVVSARADF